METEVHDNFRSIAETKFSDESAHLQDLWNIPTNVLVENESKITSHVSHVDNLYLCAQAALNALLTLLIDFTLVFKHPLYWLYMIFVYPLVIVSFFIFEISLFSLNALKLNAMKHTIGDKWYEYTYPVELCKCLFIYCLCYFYSFTY